MGHKPALVQVLHCSAGGDGPLESAKSKPEEPVGETAEL